MQKPNETTMNTELKGLVWVEVLVGGSKIKVNQSWVLHYKKRVGIAS
jgi:hypothetical protein